MIIMTRKATKKRSLRRSSAEQNNHSRLANIRSVRRRLSKPSSTSSSLRSNKLHALTQPIENETDESLLDVADNEEMIYEKK